MIQDYQNVIRREAEKWHVVEAIHPRDFLFQFLFDHPAYKSKDEAIEVYFRDGNRSARQLRDILVARCGFEPTNKISLLEFASGYGCVTRHLGNEIPFAEVTACDIHQEAMDFIEREIGSSTVLSTHQPEALTIDEQYDVVFALSFFSHMPKKSFHRWLVKLASLVKPGGVLIFTTHGIRSMPVVGSPIRFDRDGFYFRYVSEQRDIKAEEYGTAVTVPHYVLRQIASDAHLSLVDFQEGFWWEHQDVYGVRRLPQRSTQLTFPPTEPASLYRRSVEFVRRHPWGRALIKLGRTLLRRK